ncbi:MAG: hypothetical protein ACLP1Y_13385 [Candidatus Acidiferrales bacterium]
MDGTQIPGTKELGGLAPDEIRKQLSKIIHSKAFRHCSGLQRLLQYLVARAIEDPFGEIKEYTIGVETFDRGPDYDPQIDTIVRVQIHRLRQKLNEYYESEGMNDPFFVEIPKGHYIPAFESRSVALLKRNETDVPAEAAASPIREQLEEAEATPTGVIEGGPKASGAPRFFPRGVFLISLVLLVFVSGIALGTRWGRSRTLATSNPISGHAGSPGVRTGDAVETFWRSFLGNDTTPVVGYSDAVYLVDGADDMFRFRRGASDNRGTLVEPHLAQQFASSPALVAKAGPLYYDDGNTGTGQVESVFVLTRLFTQMAVQVMVKRCRLMTTDDFKQHDVILLGSPDKNDLVEQLSQTADFVWNHPNVPGPWKGEFVNRHPQPGESLTYKTERDPNTQEVKTDYGLITIEPGAVPGQYIAILGGLDTSGVAGTAQFMTSPPQMAELQKRLESLGAWTGNGAPPSFQALLRVDVEKGHDVLAVHLITVHVAPSDKNTAEATAGSGSH